MNKPRKPMGPPRKPDPDAPPACPGCGRSLDLSQPDERDADRLVGCCRNEDCRQLVIIARKEGRWMILDRTTSPATTAAAV